MGKAGRKIIDGLKKAIAGDFASVTIDGQRWMRVGLTDMNLANRLLFYSGYFEEQFPDRHETAHLSADLKAAARIVSNGRHD